MSGSEMPRSKSPRAWQRMLSGRRLDLLNPDPADVDIDDIAHGLARLARWNGQTYGKDAFSVAQHLLLVEDIAYALNPSWSIVWRRAALLHDAPEYVIGDLISPFKTAIGLDYKSFEIRLLEAIHKRFGIPVQLPEAVALEIKRADRIAAYYEATALAGFDYDEALLYFGQPDAHEHARTVQFTALVPLSTGEAQKKFLERFAELMR